MRLKGKATCTFGQNGVCHLFVIVLPKITQITPHDRNKDILTQSQVNTYRQDIFRAFFEAAIFRPRLPGKAELGKRAAKFRTQEGPCRPQPWTCLQPKLTCVALIVSQRHAIYCLASLKIT